MKLKEIFTIKKRHVYRDAETGKFVSLAYALLHPKTTVKETIS